MNLTQIIRETKSLRKLISKSAKTISKKGVKEEAEKWVVHYHRDLFESLSSFHEAIKALQYLVKSINNQRLVRKKWLRNLRIIEKSLNKLRFDLKEEILIFNPNKPFTAYQVLKKLFSRAKKEILIYDGYVEEGTLDILASIPKNIKIKILANNFYGKFLKELSKFIKEFPNCKVRQSSFIHDRFFLVDGKCFLSGTSLHALGKKKVSFIFKVAKHISKIFKNHFEDIWNQAKQIP